MIYEKNDERKRLQVSKISALWSKSCVSLVRNAGALLQLKCTIVWKPCSAAACSHSKCSFIGQATY
jgi:hypothetical protein